MNEARRRLAAIVAATVLVAGFINGAAGLAHPVLAAAATSAVTSAVTPAAAAAAGPGTFVTVAPARILDTRSGLGGVRKAAVAAHGSVSFAVTGGHGVPSASAVSAVVFNLTETLPTAAGYIRAYSSGRPMPATSSLNFAAHETRAHSVIVAPGTSGKVTLYNASAGSVELLADIAGYYTAGRPTAGGEFAPLTSTRVLDTRIGLGATKAPLQHGAPLTLQLAGRGGIPATGVSSVVLNVTVTQATSGGTVNASSGEFANTANVNFAAGQTVSNLVVVPLSDAGTVTLIAFLDGEFEATVQSIADVTGYFLAGPPSAPGRLGSLDPTPLTDSRDLQAHGTSTVSVAGQVGIPQSGISAVILDVTVTDPRGHGYVTAYPTGTTRPATSAVNFADSTVSNLVVVSVGTAGTVRLYSQSSVDVHITVDVSGFVGRIPGPLTWSTRTQFPPTGSSVYAVSCASAAFCVATEGNGTVLYFNGTTWSAPQPITSATEVLTAISCPVAGFCVALGPDAAFVYAGGIWTRTTLPGSPQVLTSVSCRSASFCMAGDFADEANAWVYNGSAWTETDTGLPLGDDGDGDTNGLVVACAATTLCLGAGTDGATARFDGTTWTRLSDLTTPGRAISCPTASHCVAVTDTSSVTFDGTRWGTSVPIHAAQRISCGSSTFCLARPDGNLAFYNGTAWTTAVAVDPDGFTDISCPTAAFCVAVDSSGAIVGR